MEIVKRGEAVAAMKFLFVSKLLIAIVYFFVIDALLVAETETPCDAAHLHHGVNIGYFNSETDTITTGNADKCCLATDGRNDFAYIHDRNFDHVRIIVQYQVDKGMVSFQPSKRLKGMVQGFIDAKLPVIFTVMPIEDYLDNGQQKVRQTSLLGEPEFDGKLAVAWGQLAELYSKDDSVCFEFVNEPEIKYVPGKAGVEPEEWAVIQENIANAVRKVSNNTIVAVGDGGLMQGLLSLPKLKEEKVIYAFHFYEPYSFTNQGADWTGSGTDWKDLQDVKYPYSSAESVSQSASGIQDLTSRLNATRDMLLATKDQIKTAIEIISRWKLKNGDIICDEFGVIKPKDPADLNRIKQDRIRWIGDVKESLGSKGIGWTFYDYSSWNFGVFDARNDVDKDVITALDLKP